MFDLIGTGREEEAMKACIAEGAPGAGVEARSYGACGTAEKVRREVGAGGRTSPRKGSVTG